MIGVDDKSKISWVVFFQELFLLTKMMYTESNLKFVGNAANILFALLIQYFHRMKCNVQMN